MQAKYHAFLTVHRNKHMNHPGLLFCQDTNNFENWIFLFTIPAHTSQRSVSAWLQVLHQKETAPCRLAVESQILGSFPKLKKKPTFKVSRNHDSAG